MHPCARPVRTRSNLVMPPLSVRLLRQHSLTAAVEGGSGGGQVMAVEDGRLGWCIVLDSLCVGVVWKRGGDAWPCAATVDEMQGGVDGLRGADVRC